MIDAQEQLPLKKNRTTGAIRKVRKSLSAKNKDAQGQGLKIPYVFCSPSQDPFKTVEWEKRKASISDEKGGVLFEQDGVSMPKSWSMLATNVVASKYFYGEIGSAQREHSLQQLIHRVARTIADWGLRDGYFASADDAEAFYTELSWLCLHQYGSFNSPVWFNCGLFQQYGVGKDCGQGTYYFDRQKQAVRRPATQYEYPQCSACFIQSVDDTMEGIMGLAASEAMLFKYGSGTGSDLSTLRSTREKLSGGGKPSGPLSFLKIYDSIASVVKSGGKTRRVQQHAGQLRVDTALVEGLGVKAFSVIGPGHVGEQGAAQ